MAILIVWPTFAPVLRTAVDQDTIPLSNLAKFVRKYTDVLLRISIVVVITIMVFMELILYSCEAL